MKLNIKEKENELFKRWKEKYKDLNKFVADGIVDENEYKDPKIIFIFKEVNDPKKGGWDLREYLKDGGRSQTWNNVSRWIHGIRAKKGSVLKWTKYYSDIDNDFRKTELSRIGVINLKKSPGTYVANDISLVQAATQDKMLIQEQYELYDPDWTICGGTGDLFKKIMELQDKCWRITNRGIRWFERAEKKFVISYVHPEARVHKPLIIYGLLDAIEEIEIINENKK
ncbi:hypothetical protein ACFL0J_05040 [Candidatus Neomarinimicrobiota bacterium]